MNFFKVISLFFLFLFSSIFITAQTGASCATAINTGTPNGTSTCYTQSNGTTGSAPCAGAGYGGSGGVTYFKFCTNASGSCVAFDITDGTNAGASYAITYYDAACTLISGSSSCVGAAATGYETTSADLGLAANTCYYVRIWNGNTGTFSICTKTAVATNNLCGSPQQISTTALAGTNLCANASVGDPPPAQFGASSLENNIWYSFTTNTLCVSPCTVVVTISNISCSGGGSGFQIGYWSGTCTGTSTTSLTYLGNTVGSGGTVTTTITGLSPGQQITVGIDGNAGANCTFSIAATNTQPLPVSLIYFYGYQEGKINHLEWASLSETNVDYYLVERSVDGINYTELGRVKAEGNTTSKRVYSIIDENVNEEFTYYRLISFDKDKSSKIFDVVSINNTNHRHLFNVFPNPGSSLITVKFDEGNMMSSKKMVIYDFKGNVVKEISLDNTSDISNVDISDLKNGIYNINYINDSGEFQSLKFVKE